MHHLRNSFKTHWQSGFFAALLVFALVLQGLITGYSHGAMAAMPEQAALCLPSSTAPSDATAHQCPCGIICQSVAFTPIVPPFSEVFAAPLPREAVALHRPFVLLRLTPRDLGLSADVRGPPSLS